MNLLSKLGLTCGLLISIAFAQQPPGPQHLYEVRPGMKEQIVIAGLGATHTVARYQSEAYGITTWTVVGKDNLATNPAENGQVSVKDGAVLSVTLWLTQAYNGEAVNLSQELFENLYSHLGRVKTDARGNRLGVRDAAVKLEVWQLSPILDEQRISFSFDDGTWFSIVIGNYGKIPRFVHAEKGCTSVVGGQCDLTPVPSTQAPPVAAIQAAAGHTERPRVALESWESEEGTGIFLPRPPRQNAQALAEMPVFIQRCPQVAAVLERRDGDYVLRFDHHYAPGGYSYGYTLFSGGGQSLGTGSNLALGSAVDAACKGILNDWSSNAR